LARSTQQSTESTKTNKESLRKLRNPIDGREHFGKKTEINVGIYGKKVER